MVQNKFCLDARLARTISRSKYYPKPLGATNKRCLTIIFTTQYILEISHDIIKKKLYNTVANNIFVSQFVLIEALLNI